MRVRFVGRLYELGLFGRVELCLNFESRISEAVKWYGKLVD